MTNEERVQHWIALSEYDLATAEAMLTSKRYLYVAFMCQQAIEKMFKAHYVKLKNDEPPYIHNLLLLAEKNGFWDILTVERKKQIDAINAYYINTRYLDYKSDLIKTLTNKICEKMLNITKEILQWTKEKISLI